MHELVTLDTISDDGDAISSFGISFDTGCCVFFSAVDPSAAGLVAGGATLAAACKKPGSKS
jgi:hypothetical protein